MSATPVADHFGSAPEGQVHYVKVHGFQNANVIANFYADGTSEFCEKPSGDIFWHPFSPSQAEAALALAILARDRAQRRHLS